MNLLLPDVAALRRILPILLLMNLTLGAQTPPPPLPDDARAWTAEWIAPDADARPNRWLAFRQAFELDQIPAGPVTARIACDSKYWLWINGALVVFEGQLKRGPNRTDSYFDTVDLSRHLRAGRNQIAVLVWHWGRHSYSHNDSGRAGLVFEARVGDEIWRTDGTWRCQPHPAHGETAEPHPNRRLAEQNIHFDARDDITGWTSIGYDDSAWPAAQTFGRPAVAPWGRLHPRPIPLWADSGLQDYPSRSAFPDPATGGTIVARLPHNANITPWLEVEGPAGRLIDLRTDNYEGGSEPNVRAEYVTREGRQSFESLGWMNGHEVRYTVPPGVTVHAVKYRETRYDADRIGAFTCDDAALNTLWQKAARTLEVTMRDTYMDCPDRERAQWWGDVVNELGEAFYVFDCVKGPALARKGMLELAAWQKPDGTLFSPVPTGAVEDASPSDWKVHGVSSSELPAQMLASVGWYGFWTYYRYTGDRETIAQVYPAVRRYLALWQLDSDGLVKRRRGGWDWTDWGTHIDATVCRNAWFHLALRGAAEMADLLGENADAARYRAQMETIRAAFNRAFWTGAQYRAPDYFGETDDRANALAVVAGLAGPDQHKALRKVFAKQRHASPYMEKYVLEALYRMDAPDEAMARMKSRWAAQIASPLTTLWEGWGLGKEGYGGGTYNHAWSGGALTALSEFASGVTPTAPGWKQFHVRPQPGSLRRLHSVTPTPAGAVTLDFSAEANGHWTLTIEVPDQLPGTLSLDGIGQMTGSITVNGLTISQPAQPIVLRPGRNVAVHTPVPAT